MALNLNDQIQEAIKNYSSASSTVSARYADQPTYEANTRADLYGGDETLKGLRSGFSEKVKELYNYDRQKNASMSNINVPTSITTPQGDVMPVNPSIQWNAEQAGFKQTLDEKEGAWQLYEERKTVLGDALTKALALYDSETKMKESDRDALEKTIGFLQKQQDLDRQDRETNDKLSNSGGTGIREIDELDDTAAVSLLKSKLGNTVGSNDVLGGTGPERGQRARDLLAAYYTGNLTLNEILTAKENTDLNDALATKTQLGKARMAFEKYKDKGVSGGTGRLAGILPDKWSSELTQSLRSDIGEIQTKMQKFYSGVAISAQEMQRLEQFLPSKNYDEKENYRKLVKLETGMNINQKIFERARLTGKTTDEVLLSEEGRKIFEDAGENYPYGESSVPKYKVTVKQQ